MTSARPQLIASAWLVLAALTTASATAGTGDDECLSASAVAGSGVFAFDNGLATTGVEQPPIGPCEFGMEGIDNDVWFCWTSDCDGLVHFELCTQTTIDSKIAVYDGCVCPPAGVLLECNDDLCDFQSGLIFNAVNTNQYLLQIGTFPGTPGGPGTFRMTCLGNDVPTCASPVTCQNPDQGGHGTDSFVAVFSDAGTNTSAADTLRITADGSITSVCWWGIYSDGVTPDCGAVGVDDFTITYYEDDGPGTVPGTLRAGPFAVAPTRAPSGFTIGSSVGAFSEWQFEAAHAPVAVSNGECLWIEIRNSTAGCTWAWVTAPPGDGHGAQDDGSGFVPIDLDYAFCIDVAGDPAGCSVIPPPPNDDCIAATPISQEGAYDFELFMSSTDGPPHAACDQFGGEPGIANDVWYCLTAPLDGQFTITTCGVTNIDTKIAVYDGCGCPVGDGNLLACNDDALLPACQFQSELTFDAVEGNDYLIRVGTFPGSSPGPGQFVLTAPFIGFEDPEAFGASGDPANEATGDFDQDGFIDVAVVIPDSPYPNGVGRVQVFLNQGNIGEVWQGLAPLFPVSVGRNPSGIAVGHFNFDVFPDLAVTNADDDTVTILLNNAAGDGGFLHGPTFAVGSQPSGVAAGDFTGNGQVDLAVINAGDNTLRIYENTSTPLETVTTGFNETQTESTGNSPNSVTTDDLDNDKCLDLAVTNGDDDTISVYRHTTPPANALGGGPYFEPQVLVAVGDEPVDISIADLDGDMVKDIVTVDRASGTLSVVVNLGGNTYAAAVTLATGTLPSSVDTGDLDNDGDADMAVATDVPAVGRAIQVFENMTPGGALDFNSPIAFPVGDNPNFVAAADLNDDAVDDLVTVNTDPTPNAGTVTALLSVVPCAGDCATPHDGQTNVVDLLTLLGTWGAPGPCDGTDGFTDVTDLLVLLSDWGLCP